MSDFDDRDALAAEYVIGTLSPDERAEAEQLLRQDAGFGRLVGEWTDRLAPLLDTIPAIEPDPRMRDAVLAEIDRLRARPAVPRVGQPEHLNQLNVIQLRRQVTRWRVATMVSAAIAALLALWIGNARLFSSGQSGTYMAVLQQGAGSPAFLVSLDLATRRMTVVPSSAEAEPNKSLELWMIGADAGVPQSLGVLDPSAPVRPRLPDVSPDMISHATYAITVEPKGGSPNGKPSAAPVFTGHLVPSASRS